LLYYNIADVYIEVDKNWLIWITATLLLPVFLPLCSLKYPILSVSMRKRVAIRFVVSCLRPHICSIDYMPLLPDSICIALSMKGVARHEHSFIDSFNQSSAIFNFFDRSSDAKNVAVLV
jgi:hypothetical protein